ncbi:MAG: hypothetical protein JNL57_09640 [Bacteroidetes bacterium]|nr:hypothetical protein [Bacteroidota bacterium]
MKNTIPVLFLFFMFISGCEKKDKEGACKAGVSKLLQMATPNTSTINYNTSSFSINGINEVSYFVAFGQANFYITSKIENVCTKTHLKPAFTLSITDSSGFNNIQIYAQAYWSTYDENYILFDGTPSPGQSIKANKEIGLKQAFGEGPGNMEFFLGLRFSTLGSFSADRKYFEKMVKYIETYCQYDNAL